MKTFRLFRDFATASLLAFSIVVWAGQYSDSHGHHSAAKENPSIVEIASENDNFSTLVTALQAADLVEVLAGEGPYTVFAPTNDAFTALPEGAVGNLLKPENKDQLVAVLTYHVVPGSVYVADITKLESASTVQCDTLKIAADMGTVKVDNANIVKSDTKASNGVIHVIDAVILPNS